MVDHLNPGEKIQPGQQLTSTNGMFALVMQQDGNLVLYRAGSNSALWASGTFGHRIDWAVLQEDGNFVIYGEGKALWSSGTYGSNVARLIVQNDGNVVIYGKSGNAIWSTNTIVHRVPTPPAQLLPVSGAVVTSPLLSPGFRDRTMMPFI
ncbi:hypothetical protein LJK88_21785 [Paenibacillus sp. P26]|nr:hypothetical protein LJK88_21785 [Paenibacillus sp. P26]